MSEFDCGWIEDELTNAYKFREIFGIYATELWAMPEQEFLNWLNAEYEHEDGGDRI